MKVLWITNIIFPDACTELNLKQTVFGGWMLASAKELAKNENFSLAVASVYNGKDLKCFNKNGIIYYLLPSRGKITRYDSSLEKYWLKITNDFKPDVVHLHGTEFAHGLAYINACGNDRVVVSIQGLVSVIAHYFRAGIRLVDYLRCTTLRDIVFGGIIRGQKDLKKRGVIEREILKNAKHVIGRTTWDKDHVRAVNPYLKYHFCNETLRDEFYKHEWDYDKCNKYSLFLSQVGSPIKGLHQVLKAMPKVLSEFPEAKLIIGGSDITSKENLYNRLKRTGYGKYIMSLIIKYKLSNHVFFTGFLSEKEICGEYLKANVFICPSSIENSPNSLGEAQLLGVPAIASYVGGIPDMMKEFPESLYRFEEYNMLAFKICRLFASGGEIVNSLSKTERAVARQRHEPSINNQRLIDIYKMVRNESCK